MSGECDKCGDHALECGCPYTNHQILKKRVKMTQPVCIHRSKSFSDMKSEYVKAKELVKKNGHVNSSHLVRHMLDAITNHTDLQIVRIRKEVNDILKILNDE